MLKKITIIFILIFILVGFLGFYTNKLINKKNNEKFVITINPGTSKKQAIKKVFKNYSISTSEQKLVLLYFLLNRDLEIHAGKYIINKNTPFILAIKNLKNGSFEEKITFLEGWTVEENALELKKIKGESFAKEYYKKAKPFIGKLYPDTYSIDSNTTPIKIVDIQTQTFIKKTKNILNKSNLSEKEILILASIVEREAKKDIDKKIIAGILIKRYKNNLPLDADATSQYGIAQKKSKTFIKECIEKNCKSYFWKKNLTIKDLKEEGGEYNTRGKVGLPPTPICNPSLKSIKAVIEPKETEYFYYLTDLNGETHYAKTLQEHIKNIQNFL